LSYATDVEQLRSSNSEDTIVSTNLQLQKRKRRLHDKIRLKARIGLRDYQTAYSVKQIAVVADVRITRECILQMTHGTNGLSLNIIVLF
jgi:hypothetical protein